jgi:sialidase-1
MKARMIRAAVTAMVLGTLSTAWGAALFEETVAVKVPRDVYGPRGMMGDIIPLGDGTLMMAFTQDGGIAAVRSHDQGMTWRQPFTLIAKPQPPAKGYFCHPSFLRLPNGEILISYIYSTYPTTPYYGHNYYRRSVDKQNPKIARRSALSTAVSRDEGQTFLHQHNIARDPDDDFGYQCIKFLGNDLAIVGYHAREGLRVARISIDWFYGK